MGLALRALRTKAGLQQSELGKLVGVSNRVISAWEREETQLTINDACKLANVLNCTLDELAGREDAPENVDPRLARNYRAMAPEGRAALLAASDALAKQLGNVPGGGCSVTALRLVA